MRLNKKRKKRGWSIEDWIVWSRGHGWVLTVILVFKYPHFDPVDALHLFHLLFSAEVTFPT